MHPYRFLCLFIFASLTASASEKTPTAVKPSPVMVVTANPHATEAGLEILRAGGSAVDAAIAIEAVLSLVEPQSSGLAGGGFMVHFDASENAISVFDGRETAPAASSHPGASPDPRLFLAPIFEWVLLCRRVVLCGRGFGGTYSSFMERIASTILLLDSGLVPHCLSALRNLTSSSQLRVVGHRERLYVFAFWTCLNEAFCSLE